MHDRYERHRDDRTTPLMWISDDVGCLPHFHAGVELIYVRSGTASGVINGHAVTIGAKALAVVGCYDIHCYDHSSVEAIVCFIPLNALPTLRKRLSSGSLNRHTAADDVNGTLGQLLAFMYDHRYNPHAANGISEAVMGVLIEKLGMTENAARDNTPLMCKVLTYLEEHFREPITVETLAEQFGYSRSRFSHLFKSELGYSLPRYLGSLRARHAAQLLVATDMTVTAVADECGFANIRTFYNAFDAEFGMTPTEYVSSGHAAE